MARKRSRIDIIGDMLTTIQTQGGEIKPTHLMYKSNLSHAQMTSYLDDLVDKHFVSKIKKEQYEYIIITDKGSNFLQKLQEMREFEQTFGL
jgi:predicted transcriptional regulator